MRLSNPIKNISCPHFESCSGCVKNVQVDQPSIYFEAKNFFEQKGILNFRLHVGDVCGWRSRAKLAVRGTSQDPQIGLFKAHSHQVVDIPLCKVHHPSINAAVEKVKKWICAEGIIPYDEGTCQGDLRYIQLVVESLTGRIQLALVWNDAPSSLPRWKLTVRRLWEQYPDAWHSIWLNFNTRHDNIIFGEEWNLIDGNEWLWERYVGVDVCFHPASFAQANVQLFEEMLRKIQEAVPKNARVAEFYAGVGVIGLALSRHSRWVKCCEVNPMAKICFEESIKKLNPEEASKLFFYSSEASKALDLIEEADMVIVDPPRKGIDKVLLKVLKEIEGGKELIYISCGWNGFQKDHEVLSDGGWIMTEAEGYLFFPGSNHIEVLAIFKKG